MGLIMHIQFIEIQGFSNKFPYTTSDIIAFNDYIQDNNVVIVDHYGLVTVAIRRTGKGMAEFSVSIRSDNDVDNTNIGVAHAMQRMITGQCLPCRAGYYTLQEQAIKIAETLV